MCWAGFGPLVCHAQSLGMLLAKAIVPGIREWERCRATL